jgi:hypothetical protein
LVQSVQPILPNDVNVCLDPSAFLRINPAARNRPAAIFIHLKAKEPSFIGGGIQEGRCFKLQAIWRLWRSSVATDKRESETDRRRWRMLLLQLWGTSPDRLALQDALDRLWACPACLDELRDLFTLLLERTDHLAPPLDWDQPVPLALHARYSRAEIYAAFGLISDTQQTTGQSGVLFDRATQCDVFFITLKKSERLFSPTTRYNDYAISPWEFHWESQSLTREASATGQRYIHHVERGSRVLLLVREESKRGGVTLPFLCLGFAEYVSHEGERPMAIRWRLHRAIPGGFSPELAVAV